MELSQSLLNHVYEAPLADTHEHLFEEETRLNGGEGWKLHDIGVFFTQYVDSDLHVAGMPLDDIQTYFKPDVAPDVKWRMISPWWERMKHTGYGMCVRESVKALFGIQDLNDETWTRVQEGLEKLIKPGYYKHVLKDITKLDHIQVNSLEVAPFCETAYPDMMLQDLSFVHLGAMLDVPMLERVAGRQICEFEEALECIDITFERYAPRAVAMKSQEAYGKRLNPQETNKKTAEGIFNKVLKEKTPAFVVDRRPLDDYLFDYCMKKGEEYQLPVKLHTGYHAGHNAMPLHMVATNPGDMSDLCRRYPGNKFVFMHSCYPFQEQAIAVAKQYENAYIDLCWSWIINPVASVRFVKEFLGAVSASKLFLFGGDFGMVEMIPGHASIARKGLHRALLELVQEGWLRESDLEGIVQRLLLGNAEEFYDLNRCRLNNC